MSITFTGSITPTPTIVFKDACTNEAANTILFIESNSNSLRQYNLSTLSQVGVNLSVTPTPVAITMIAAGSAVVANSGSSADLIELATGYQQNFTGGGAISSFTVRAQQGAGDTTSRIAFFCATNTNRILSKFDGNSFTFTQVTMAFQQSEIPNCIIFKETGRFLVGTSAGRVYEIDTAGNIVDKFDFFFDNFYFLNSSMLPSIVQLAYADGFLTISYSQGIVSFIDWTTKTLLDSKHDGTQNGMTFSNSASGEFLVSRNYTTAQNNVIYEMDTSISGLINIDHLFTDSTGSISACGINTTNNLGWSIQNTANKIRVFSVNPTSRATRIVTTLNNAPARVIIIDETGGQGTLKRVVDTYTTSPRTFRLETGKSYIELVKINDGTNATWDASRYST